MNATRRTLSQTLTRSQREFLTLTEPPISAPNDGVVASSMQPVGSNGTKYIELRRPRQAAKYPRSADTHRQPEPLRSVTLRLRASVAEALRGESIRRSLDYLEPFSQQAIVEAAVCSWLRGQGCRLDD